jgi:hypothetical protein
VVARRLTFPSRSLLELLCECRRVGERAYQQAQKLIAERKLMDEAAMWLRGAAIRDGYAGFRRAEVAFAMASVMDMLALHWDEVPERVRREVLSTCRRMVTERDRDPNEPSLY